jgi:hypothetical protein
LAGSSDDEARQKINNRHALDTSRIHGTDPTSVSRRELHKEIIAKVLAGGVPSKGTPEAIFTAGGPASGKSGLAGAAKEQERNLSVPHGAVVINPDLIKEMLPEYGMLKKSGRTDIAASAVHEESSFLAKKITAIAMQQHIPVVIDGVGNSEKGKFAGKIATMRKNGYKVTVRYAHLPIEEAKRREVMRASDASSPSFGRKVDHSMLEAAHGRVSARYNSEIKHMPGVNVEIYSTMGRGKPKLIAKKDTSKGKGVHVIDRNSYNEFVSKSSGPAGKVVRAARAAASRATKSSTQPRPSAQVA